MTSLERISIEVTNQCSKSCWFCCNHSTPTGRTEWAAEELISVVRDCADSGVKAVSFGGGEPLQFDPLFDVLAELRGILFRSITTNGLLLSRRTLRRLVAAAPEKVHVSIHFPERDGEVQKVLRQVHDLTDRGIKSGINFLVARSKLEAARRAAAAVRAGGVSNERITYLPMREQDTPTPDELAQVAGNEPFQATTCLLACRPSPRFCSIRWDKTVAWCSYTTARRPLDELTYRGLVDTLKGLAVTPCGGNHGD